ncbi:reverse transcriptase [Alcaligenaceae bacterium CGII-47]|nr:reverse transcriptase [Alcaligenaceae bacterium CGII-47]
MRWRRHGSAAGAIRGWITDTIDHELLMKAVRHHTDDRWVLLYIERWMKADLIREDGTCTPRARGTPQGGVISPLLANLFLHYVFDCWMGWTWPDVPFARYADDAVCHCRTQAQAQQLVDSLGERFAACGLTLHPEKAHVVSCREGGSHNTHPIKAFNFLGYAFQTRTTRARAGHLFVGFKPAVSRKALKAMHERVRSWQLHRRTQRTLQSLAAEVNSVIVHEEFILTPPGQI